MDIKEALDNAIDDRLREHGLLEQEADPKPATGKGKGKPAAGKKKAEEITIDSLREKCKKLVEDKGKPELKKLLTKYKAATLTDMDEDKFTKFNADLDKLLGEEDAGEGGDDDDLFGE